MTAAMTSRWGTSPPGPGHLQPGSLLPGAVGDSGRERLCLLFWGGLGTTIPCRESSPRGTIALCQEKKPEAPKLSKKKLRRMNRFTVAELKQVRSQPPLSRSLAAEEGFEGGSGIWEWVLPRRGR